MIAYRGPLSTPARAPRLTSARGQNSEDAGIGSQVGGRDGGRDGRDARAYARALRPGARRGFASQPGVRLSPRALAFGAHRRLRGLLALAKIARRAGAGREV